MNNISLKELILKNKQNFKQSINSHASNLKKSVAPRLMAVMLAGASLASLASCDKIPDKQRGELYNEACSVEVVDGVCLANIASDEDANSYSNHIKQLYPYGAVPYNFLQEQGLLSENADGTRYLNEENCFLKNSIMVDENSPDNDVYMFLSYEHRGKNPEDNYICTWKLKYVLEDNDYQNLLFLGSNTLGDIRMYAFIDLMDKNQSPEIMFKYIQTKSLSYMSSAWASTRGSQTAGYVENYNPETGDLQVRVLSLYDNYAKEVIFASNIKNGKLWEDKLEKGYTDTELLEANLQKFETPLGIGYLQPVAEDVLSYGPFLHRAQGSIESLQFVTCEPYEEVAEYKLLHLPHGYTATSLGDNNYTKSLEDLNNRYLEEKEKYSIVYPEDKCIQSQSIETSN